MLTLYVAGMSQVVLGIQALLWCPGYNVFADLGTIPILFSVYALCAVLERFCRWGGKAFGLWAIDESVARLEQQGQGGDIKDLYKQIDAPKKFRAAELASGAPTKVKFYPS